ncbi:pyridoxamine 5'-phosphate oxidase family protein [Notoacmeibacter sp. MSK16QG-6]|uniref:pyridoxamine 5'-phosphate oxidase family protein n=1 Tax=Notoacmeibacter sp. MSK16QG-6 TaxID=2957982 RepID=UPI0020A01C46|nr:pyridoxamine 5'-phosphate oxidase family protein [Notoacmeibacter sp. MSK16QG-6]MCP1198235.1 pyridoxamine 5'-phosphate oxidase family protein [Notoacmeibacter sp. MSK16QG-6]
MTEMTLSDLAERMAKIDICMLCSKTAGNRIGARPMSNNSDVEYDGTSYFFTLDDARMVADIEKDPQVCLTFQGENWLSLALEGKARVIQDKAAFRDHWVSDLDAWFKDGVDTEGLVLLEVTAERIAYWDGEDNGELVLDGSKG